MFGNDKNDSKEENFTPDIFLWGDQISTPSKEANQNDCAPKSNQTQKKRRIARRDLAEKAEKKVPNEEKSELSKEIFDTPVKPQEEKTSLQEKQTEAVPKASSMLLEKREKKEKKDAVQLPLPEVNQTLDLSSESLESFLKTEKEKERKETTKQKTTISLFGKWQKGRSKAMRTINEMTTLQTRQDAVKASLDGMYGVYTDPKKNRRKKLTTADIVRYSILFVCIFGFFSAGFFVFQKLYDYYRAYVIYSGLQEMVAKEDLFASEYLKKAKVSFDTLTPAEILEGKTPEGSDSAGTFTKEQATLVGKIAQLKNINSDTAGWITIDGTVVNYPLLWSSKRDYYLRRDFYKKSLSGGSIFLDDRNDPDVTKNRNTVIYGHNMSDGSMFASIHDFASASVFYGTKIEIATEDGIFVYTPFSVHTSNAFDNYFETDFVSDDDFIDFCEQMAFISLFETEYKFNKNTQIITLSTCTSDQNATNDRFALHAVLTKVIR